MADVMQRFKPGDILSNGEPFDLELHKVLSNGVVQDTRTGDLLTVPMPNMQERFKAGDTMPNGTVFDPETHRILKNGAVYDTIRKRIVCAPAPEHAPITKSNAKAVASARWERARDAFAAGVSEGMTGREDVPEQAWSRVGRKAAELLKEAKSARGFADLARFTGEAAGFVPMARGREEMQEQPATEQPLTVVLVAQFVQMLQPPTDPPVVIDRELKD